MCEMCGTDEERQRAKKALLSDAERMEDLAARLREYAAGNPKPHTDKVEYITVRARAVMRSLIDWI